MVPVLEILGPHKNAPASFTSPRFCEPPSPHTLPAKATATKSCHQFLASHSSHKWLIQGVFRRTCIYTSRLLEDTLVLGRSTGDRQGSFTSCFISGLRGNGEAMGSQIFKTRTLEWHFQEKDKLQFLSPSPSSPWSVTETGNLNFVGFQYLFIHLLYSLPFSLGCEVGYTRVSQCIPQNKTFGR